MQESLSIIVPLYNEEENVRRMVEQVHLALENYEYPWELIFINDGSEDQTLGQLYAVLEHWGSHIRIIDLQRNFGQTAAMQAGIDMAKGTVLVTMDGDMQNDPSDIPRMVKRLIDEDLDLVAGWRKDRKDNLWLRKIPSRAANKLIGKLSGVRLNDYGCTLKAFRKSVLESVRLYGEMHRFIPAWIASYTSPKRIKEEVVKHHPRRFGDSKYGLSRIYKVLLDLFSVYFFMRFKSKPAHFFGKIGLLFGMLGGCVLSYLAYIKFFMGESIGHRPLLTVGVLFTLVSIQFITTGILGELMTRTYYEASNTKPYTARSSSSRGVQHSTWFMVSDSEQHVRSAKVSTS